MPEYYGPSHKSLSKSERNAQRKQQTLQDAVESMKKVTRMFVKFLSCEEYTNRCFFFLPEPLFGFGAILTYMQGAPTLTKGM